MSWSFRRIWRAIAAVGLCLFILFAGIVGRRTSRALHTATEAVRSEGEIRFIARPLPEPQEQDFEGISTPAVFFQAARFLGDLYIAGPAGLSQYNASGTLLKHYAVGRDLPSSPLVAIAPAVLADSQESELVIATGQDGLLVFNGRAFRQIFPQDASTRTITSVLAAVTGHLLVGTRKRGVLLYDGKKMTVLHPTLSNLYVTTLAGTESDLWVGTLNQGVLHWHAGGSFGEEQGLPDRQVQSIAVSGDTTFVGTVLGVAVFEHGRFSRTLADGVLTTALLPSAGQILVGSEDQGVIAMPLEGRRRRPNPALADATELVEVHQLLAMDDTVFALTRSGLYRMGAHGFGWQPVLRPGAAVLSDRNVSALATDSKGRLWVGYFDRGLDRLESDHGPATHIESEHVFCVNRILPNPKDGTIDVATANGLVRFDSAGNRSAMKRSTVIAPTSQPWRRSCAW
jgi:ligand-binding sensor domain-containing protein